jgi:hypothetical protein
MGNLLSLTNEYSTKSTKSERKPLTPTSKGKGGKEKGKGEKSNLKKLNNDNIIVHK